jgi:hypothetical protein
MKKRYLLITLIIFFSLHAYCQNNATTPQVLLPSPSASSLGVFGEFPEALPTGVPSINIPIYNVRYRSSSIPISLSYNVNLIKVDAHPDWVGLGWDISKGGSIHRVVNDKPDDFNFISYRVHSTTNENGVGYYYNHDFFLGSTWSDASHIQNASKDILNYPNQGQYYNVPSVVKDYQPDEFSFNFLKYSGTFYLDENRNWKVRCDQKVKVTFNNADFVKNGFGKFTLTDPQGVKYVFGGADNSIEYSQDLFAYDQQLQVPSTWNLTKIILPNAETIDFLYENGNAIIVPENDYITLGLFPNDMRHRGSLVGTVYLKTINTKNEQIQFIRSPSTQLTYPLFYTVDRGAWLSALQSWDDYNAALPTFDPFFDAEFAHGILTTTNTAFTTSLNYAKLDEIRVVDNATQTVKKRFSFSYNNVSSQRLKLQSVTEYNADLSVSNDIYKFRYSNDSNSQLVLPDYLTDKTDDFGNYNGKTPVYDQDLNAYQTSKLPDLTAAQSEILTQVIYPSGGYTAYQYELNSYSKEVDYARYNPLINEAGDKIAGGLRIAEIDNFDKDGTKTNWVKYAYVNNYSPGGVNLSSSGILGGKSKYMFINGSGHLGYVSASSTLPAANNNNGSPIAYSEVAEIFSDGGYQVSHFTNFDNGEYMDEAPITNLGTIPSSTNQTNIKDFTSKAFERGKLSSKSVYNASGQILSDETISYTAIDKANNFVKNISTESNASWIDMTQLHGTAFKTYTYAYLPFQKTTTVYQNSTSAVVQTINYTYDPVNLNLTKTVTSNSKGETKETDYLYPSDMVSSGQDQTGVYAAMVNMNNVSAVVQKKEIVNLVQQSLVKYDYVNPSIGIYVPSVETVKYQQSPEQIMAQFITYDDLGNLLSQTRPNGVKESYLWSYQRTLPVAKTINAPNTKTISIQPIRKTEVLNGVAGNIITFTTFKDGDIALSIQLLGAPSTNFSIAYDLSGIGTTLCFPFNNSSSCGPNSPPNITYTNIPAGTYTLRIGAVSSPGNIPVQAGISYTYEGTQSTSSGSTGFFYEGFEDNVAETTGIAHTGSEYHNGSYTVNWIRPDNRAYKISYWYRTGGAWKYQPETDYSVTSMTLSGGDAYDDIRIYPSDAQMTTYTYDPLVGMTSMTDEKGLTTYYEYDAFQRLMNIKDKDGNIVKHMDYHYQNQ